MVRKIAVLAIAALAAASCSNGGGDAVVSADANVDAHALSASADRTAEAGTGKVHVTMVMSMTGPKAGTPIEFTFTGDGAYDRAADLSSMTVDLGSMLSSVLSSLPADEQDEAGGALDGLSGQTEEIVQHGDVVYLRAPMLTAFDPALADKWIRIDGSKLGAMAGSGASTSPLSGVGGMGDPSATLEYLKGAGADVTTIGPETIDGVDTTHVHATVSMRQALDAAGSNRDELEQSLKNLPGGVGDAFESFTFPVDVYVDADGYVRRIAITYDLGDVLQSAAESLASSSHTSVPGNLGATMTMTVDYRDFGQPVSITEPAESETVSICDLGADRPGGLKAGSPFSGLC
jgi:hypothetical protein